PPQLIHSLFCPLDQRLLHPENVRSPCAFKPLLKLAGFLRSYFFSHSQAGFLSRGCLCFFSSWFSSRFSFLAIRIAIFRRIRTLSRCAESGLLGEKRSDDLGN